MILRLKSVNDISPKSIKKINNLLLTDTLIFISAEWCSFCKNFIPEKEKFLKKKMNINVIDIDNEALNSLKNMDNKTYKLIIPNDGHVYFPMILHISNKNGRMAKKLYDGKRTSIEMNKFFFK